MDKKRMKEALELLQDIIPLYDNKDAYMWDIADWGLGNIEKPDPENYNEGDNMQYKRLFNKLYRLSTWRPRSYELKSIITFVLENYKKCHYCGEIFESESGAFCCKECENKYHEEMWC